uniref:Uncharacterized protein n=1 Tax=Tetraselmis sp. GSL018 TaxID=582737 RepID=A0A061QMW7_9CHLO
MTAAFTLALSTGTFAYFTFWFLGVPLLEGNPFFPQNSPVLVFFPSRPDYNLRGGLSGWLGAARYHVKINVDNISKSSKVNFYVSSGRENVEAHTHTHIHDTGSWCDSRLWSGMLRSLASVLSLNWIFT